MEIHCYNAWILAHYLENHPMVEKCVYPGLKSHPQYKLAVRFMRDFGGMITFYIKGGTDEARVFLSSLKVFTLAESLGGVESLAESPSIMTHGSVPPEQRKELNIIDSMIRLSVGIEEVEDLLEDLDRSFEKVRNMKGKIPISETKKSKTPTKAVKTPTKPLKTPTKSVKSSSKKITKTKSSSKRGSQNKSNSKKDAKKVVGKKVKALQNGN